MKPSYLFLILGVVAAMATPGQAQWFFSKKAKVKASQRVPELILVIKTEPNDRKRAQAAEELREFDTRTFTEIVPVLADVLLHDKKANVRAEALTSLARIRPVTALAGQTLEKASGSDESWRIRLQARAALTRYYLAGYSAKKTSPPPAAKKTATTTSEPPLPAPRFGAPRVEDSPPPIVAPVPKEAPGTRGPSLFP
ncbi:MAG: HEAT repeat domain-containing protein [Planctomycetes bacterium]|nr:HEAT repeat domain-containing protein [Planctomycetota bacterium]